jgi:alpha-methylacyl-CoA racemase
MTGPLEGLRIIEMAGLGPGPFCAMMLADHGADVVRIDRLGAAVGSDIVEGDPTQAIWNRSRRGVAVNLKDARGVALMRRLCAGADALIEGYRPGVMERLGLGPEILLADNPKLVYGRMTGWGQDGPYARMAGHDINYIALSGALHGIGRKGEKPVPPLNLVGDFGGGGMMLAFGILAALLNARTTGKGQVVDCAMTEGSAMLMAMIYGLHAQGRWQDERGLNFVDTGAHFYETYETADAKFIAVGAIEPHFYRLFLELIGLSGVIDPASQNDPSMWTQHKRDIAARFKTKTRAAWCAVFEGQDACVAPVLSLTEAPQHAHNVARGAFVVVAGAHQPAPAPRFSATRSANPVAFASGETVTDDIFGAAAFAPEEILSLRRDGVLA